MFEFFKEYLGDLDYTCKQVNSNRDDIAPIGRFEFVNDGVVTIFGDMKHYDPECEVDIQTDYSAMKAMMGAIQRGDMAGAIDKSRLLGKELIDVQVKKKSTLNQRMADVEYPFLYMLRDTNQWNFTLLNPSKGTLNRVQKVFADKVVPIVMTVKDSHYMAELNKVNEMGWPMLFRKEDELDPQVVYYGGFTGKKFLSRLKMVAFEINPMKVITTYRGEYEWDEDLRHISIVRSLDYKYEDFYPRDSQVEGVRIKADELAEILAMYKGYERRSWGLMYNLVYNCGLEVVRRSVSDIYTESIWYERGVGCYRSDYATAIFYDEIVEKLYSFGHHFLVKEEMDVKTVLPSGAIKTHRQNTYIPYGMGIRDERKNKEEILDMNDVNAPFKFKYKVSESDRKAAFSDPDSLYVLSSIEPVGRTVQEKISYIEYNMALKQRNLLDWFKMDYISELHVSLGDREFAYSGRGSKMKRALLLWLRNWAVRVGSTILPSNVNSRYVLYDDYLQVDRDKVFPTIPLRGWVFLKYNPSVRIGWWEGRFMVGCSSRELRHMIDILKLPNMFTANEVSGTNYDISAEFEDVPDC